jgi:tetratricopeptide (TPR) repeat protein
MKMAAEPQQAAAEFEAALKLDPQNVEAKIALGDALRRLRKYDEAAACYQTAAQLQPSNWTARHWNALIKFAYGNRDEEATEMLEVVKLARPKGKHQVAEFWGQYSRTRTSHIFQHGFDYPEAVYHCIILDGLETERNGKSQGRALAGLMIGSALVDAGLPEKGDEYLSQALTDPTLGTQARYYHALACQALGKTQEAEQALQQVVTENTRHPTAYKALAEIASQAGDLERAQQFMTKHRQNNPE